MTQGRASLSVVSGVQKAQLEADPADAGGLLPAEVTPADKRPD
jgi:hypothetical protein